MDTRLDSILGKMASSLSAESIRINISASNLANSQSIGGSEESTYHARHAIYEEVKNRVVGLSDSDQPLGGVRVVDVVKGKKPLDWHYDPDNPLADKDGRVFTTDVDPIAEMTDMIASSKQYQAGVDVMNTTKSLLLKTIHALNN